MSVRTDSIPIKESEKISIYMNHYHSFYEELILNISTFLFWKNILIPKRSVKK